MLEGDYTAVAFTASGPFSGSVQLDANTLLYAGLEPITFVGTAGGYLPGFGDGSMGNCPCGNNSTARKPPSGDSPSSNAPP